MDIAGGSDAGWGLVRAKEERAVDCIGQNENGKYVTRPNPPLSIIFDTW